MIQTEVPVQQLRPVVRTITVCRCELRLGSFVVRGEPEILTIEAALKRFASSKNHDARMNVLNARVGNFLGTITVQGKGEKSFLLVNQTADGDIGWLLKKKPEFESLFREVYRVVDVEIPRTAIDLPPLGFSDQGAR